MGMLGQTLYIVEKPQWGTFNEYNNTFFLWRSQKNINSFGWKKQAIYSYDSAYPSSHIKVFSFCHKILQ